MTPFQSYMIFLALKQHFKKEQYDFFKYQGKVKVSKEKFEVRKDKYFFEKLSRHNEPQGLVLSNIIENEDIWIGNLFNYEAIQIHLNWKRRIESLSYYVFEDFTKLETNFNSNFIVPSNEHPPLLIKYLSNNIQLETMIILDDLVSYSEVWNNKLINDMVWETLFFKMRKYKPFLKYDSTKYKTQLIDQFKT